MHTRHWRVCFFYVVVLSLVYNIKMKPMNFFTVDADYCNYLRRYDPKVFYNAGMKSTRPFIGPLFPSRAGVDYYAPLSSHKHKHDALPRSVEYMRIGEDRKGLIMFRNMLAVPEQCLKRIDMFNYPSDSKETEYYRTLLRQQKNIVRRNSQEIIDQAKTLYELYWEASPFSPLRHRVCDFATNEKSCRDYMHYLSGEYDDSIIERAARYYRGWNLLEPSDVLAWDPDWRQSVVDGFMRGFSDDDVELLAGYRIVIDPMMSVDTFRQLTIWLYGRNMEVRPWEMDGETIESIREILMNLYVRDLPVTVRWLESRSDMLKGHGG